MSPSSPPGSGRACEGRPTVSAVGPTPGEGGTQGTSGAPRNVRLLVQYDGTRYHGFQRQAGGLATIQGELEAALERCTGERETIYGAGRTDAGVHALGQVVGFTTAASIPADRFPYALNAGLPPDIVVVDAAEADPRFHARKAAREKTYRYSIWRGRFPSPFWRAYALHFPGRLDLEAVRTAARQFEGRHDFAAFRATGSSARTTVRTVRRCEVLVDGSLAHILVTADGFLYRMVRMMTGMLLEVGRGRFGPDEARRRLEAPDSGPKPPAAPSHGLCLVEVVYGRLSPA